MDKGIILHIELGYIKPKIWRKFIVPSDITFADLHHIVQAVMGWDNAHLYQFFKDYNGDRIGMIFDDGWGLDDMLDAETVKISDYLANKGDSIYYEYDFGDGWQHLIKVKELKKDEKHRDGNYPRCLEGANACPPEDCGGFGGFEYLMEVLSNKKHPEHKDMKEWMGGNFDREYFNLDEINQILKRI